MTADDVFARVPLQEIAYVFESWSATRHGRTQVCVAAMARDESRYHFVCNSRAEAVSLINEVSELIAMHNKMKGAS